MFDRLMQVAALNFLFLLFYLRILNVKIIRRLIFIVDLGQYLRDVSTATDHCK